MSNFRRIGLGNTLKRHTVVFHGGIVGRDSFGRITDQVSVWFKAHHQIQPKMTGDIRVLMQAMMEFGFSEKNSSNGHIEVAVENDVAYVALRFQNFIVEPGDVAEKTLAQYWLNSAETALIKRILYPQDVVEIRFSSEINLVELRIVRPFSVDSVSHDQQSFRVIADADKELKADHQEYFEMGDFNQSEWVAEIYKNPKTKPKTGEMYSSGKAVQAEEEWSRVVVDRQIQQIEDDLKRINTGKKELLNTEKVMFKGHQGEVDLTEINESSFEWMNEKNKRFERLIREKEAIIQKQNSASPDREKDLALIAAAQNGGEQKATVVSGGAQGDAKNAMAFREKALQMFEMAKKLQTEKQELEKQIADLKKPSTELSESASVESSDVTVVSSGVNQQADELFKKVDRLSRALEAEKSKVKTLVDRVTVAEKEAQSASPMIEDLEGKVEVALKNAQQYKKETENVKQKLVQSEAEKNKIKNELLKAEAQIQTLMKRHAS